MTENLSVLSSLKSIFIESSWPWAIPALKHDPIIWTKLADQDFFNQVSAASQEPRDWAPHKLAAIVLGQKDLTAPPDKLESESQAALSQFLETGSLTSELGDDFKGASLIAVALYRCFQSDDRQEIDDALRASTSINSAWFTPMAVLFGLMPDQVQLVKHLVVQLDGTNIYPLIVHTMLSQPLPIEEAKQVLWDVLEELTLVKSAALLDQLCKYRPEMSMVLANEWLQANPPQLKSESSSALGEQLEQVTENLLTAQMLTLAGQLEKAEQLKTRSLGGLSALQIEVSNQLVAESLLDKNIEYALSQWTRTSASPKLTPPASLVVELLRA